MPIQGLTDRESVKPRFTRLGKIRKGYKDEEGQMHDLDYFRFVASRPEIQKAFENHCGREPRLLHILLPYPTVEENWESWLEEWGKSGLIHRCDGQYMVRWLQPDKSYAQDPQQQKQMPCPYESRKVQRTMANPGCRPVGYLSVIIPELLAEGFVGNVIVETHSLNDLANISSSLINAEEKARNAGNPHVLQFMEFVLYRQEEEIGIRYQRDGKIIKTRDDKWMIRLDPAREWVRAMIDKTQGQVLKLPAPSAEEEIIEGEVVSPEPEEAPVPEKPQVEIPPWGNEKFAVVYTLAFDTVVWSLLEEPFRGNYLSYLVKHLTKIGHDTQKSRKALLQGLFGSSNLKEFPAGWFMLLEAYADYVGKADDKMKGDARRMGREYVQYGVQNKADWGTSIAAVVIEEIPF